uniref:Uncharacterized protein n=1 Tax=Anguilla anguilla TaxID=7936 RepID=A0A0E9SCB0_ANGAN
MVYEEGPPSVKLFS